MMYLPELLLDRLDIAPVQAIKLSLCSGTESVISSGALT